MGFLEFFSAEPSRPTVAATGGAISRRRERAPRITDYFQVRELPRLSVDNSFWSARSWRRAAVERVPLKGLYATQSWISTDGLRHHSRPGARPDGGSQCDLPWVVCCRGSYYLIDGHHRACCALERGERHIKARVQHPTGGPR